MNCKSQAVITLLSAFCLNSALIQRQAKEQHNALPGFELNLFCDFLGMIYPAVHLLPEEISFHRLGSFQKFYDGGLYT